jgi:internalin A
VKNLSLLAIVVGVVLTAGASPCLSVEAEEQSVDQAVRSMRGIQVDKLSKVDKESKAVELDKAWTTLGTGGPTAVKALHQALAEDRQNGNSDDFFALAAAALLWKIGGATEADEIARIWQTARQTVNYNYVYGTALMAARTRDQRVLPMLRALLHEKQGNFFVFQHAMTLAWPQSMEFVWGMYGPGGMGCLQDVLEHSNDPAELETAMVLLAGAQQVEALPAIRRLVKHEHADVRAKALECLGTFGHPQDYELLAAGLDSGNADDLIAHINGFTQYGDLRAATLVARHADSPDEKVRQAAIQALMELPCPQALAAIQKREGVASDADEKKFCQICTKRLTDFVGATWEVYSAKSPAEQQNLFNASRKKLEEEQSAPETSDRKLTRAEFVEAAKQWQQDHRITGEKYKWIEPRHILAVATADDLPLLLDVRARVYERVSDECLEDVAKLDGLIFRLGRSRYRQDAGPLSIPYGWTPAPDAEAEKAIAAIKKASGKITVDENSPGKPVVGLILTGFPVNDAVMKHLKGLTQLRTLDLRYARFTHAGLEYMKGLTQLRALDLGGTEVTNASLGCLAAMSDLQTLNLQYTQIDDAGLERLKGLAQLQEINLSRTGVTDAGLQHLKVLPQLKTLGLQQTQVTDSGLQTLKEMKQLQSLDLSVTKVTDAGLEHLNGLDQLQGLNVSDTKVTDVGLKQLRHLNQLRTIELSGEKITDAGLENIAGMSHLQTLGLWNTQVTDGWLEHLKGFTLLQKLVLGKTEVTNAGLERLEGLDQLQYLDLRFMKNVTDAGLEHLEGLKELRSLFLSHTKITDAGLKHLAGLTELQVLELDGTEITDTGLEHLTGMKHLRSISLPREKVTDAGRRKLKEALPNLPISEW